MKYTAQNLAKALFKLIQDNPQDYQAVINGFMNFCVAKHLTYLLPSFFREFKLEIKREEEIKTLKIFSAGKLDKIIIKKIQELTGAKSSDLTELVEDKNIIAGVIAYYQNKIFDASLDNNLRLLKNKLV